MADSQNIQPTALVPQPSRGETAIAASTAHAVAQVQARYSLAKGMPRNLDQVRLSLLNECKRPRFAEVAIYNKPIGKGVTGPSIRFVETAMRCLGNLLPEVTTIFDDEDRRILRVSVTDLESNVTYTRDITITKTVERRSLARDQVAMSSRTNSRGETVYLVRASEDDLLNKEGALVSKAMRTLGLRLIPGDLIDEALDQVETTMRNKAAEDPDAARKRMVDSFAGVGVKPADLVAYLKHGLDQLTPNEISHLRAIYSAIKDGESKWSDVIGVDAPDDVDVKPEAPAQSKTEKTKELLSAKRNGNAKAEPGANG